jgi:transaldolase
MKIFIDTANLDDIKEIMEWGIIDGCTTNPKILSQEENCNFETRMKEIIELVDGPVSIEVTTNDTDEMIKEAEEFSKWGDNVVVKIPIGPNGLKAVKYLSKKGIKTNVTACMTASQAILAAKVGATYVSIFMGRICDLGYDGTKVIEDTVKIFDKYNFKTEIIVGSIRHLADKDRAALAGAHIITISPKLLRFMATNSKTDETIAEFLEFWEKFKNNGQNSGLQ